MDQKTYLVLAYYHLHPIANVQKEVADHKRFLHDKDIVGRIYISEEGINGQMSGEEGDAKAYMEWMRTRTEFQGIEFKLHSSHENIFAKLIVKERKELVAFGKKVDLSKRGEHVSPKVWKEMLNSHKEYLVLDVRNDYEWEVGHFEGALKPEYSTFKDFTKQAERLAEEIDPNTEIMMYCTGGIRCEYYSAALKERGFDKVYQLDGGVINYGLQEGNEKWKGKLFVFDDRLTIPIADEGCPDPIAHCHRCGLPADQYFNCANMDCNELFISCRPCLEELSGCCQGACMSAERLRPLEDFNGKPFRKWYAYLQNKKIGKAAQ